MDPGAGSRGPLTTFECERTSYQLYGVGVCDMKHKMEHTPHGADIHIYIDMITINHKCNLAICRTINVYCIIMIQSSQLVTQGWVFYLCSALFYTSH